MIKALIVGVSEYTLGAGCKNLPLCLNDIQAMKKALISGLAVKESNVLVLGENKVVNIDDFISTFNGVINSVDTSDTFIFYFSGHGAELNSENYLVLSNKPVSTNEVISLIDRLPCKNKIVIIDACHSGNKNVTLESPLNLQATADQFVGHGCAIFASCAIDETSGFNYSRNMSRYTCILYDALTNPYLIRNGKKSLEEIKQYVDRLADISNKSIMNKQHNAFRSSIVGTISFEVEEYKPYTTQKIYKETERYIIYSVKPVHANVKRISLEVILRFPFSKEDISDIAEEIKKDALSYEVYDNKISEERWKGKPNNIIFTYYGYSETDMINHTYAFRSTWVDSQQDKDHWYHLSDKSSVINDVWIEEYSNYSFMRKFISDNTADDVELTEATRNCMYEMILSAEKFLGYYREYINRTITEDTFTNSIKPLLTKIRELFLEQSDFSIPSKDLHKWSEGYSSLAATIDEFVVIYDPSSKRDSKNRKQLMDIAIKRYNDCLERVKELDIEFANRFDD